MLFQIIKKKIENNLLKLFLLPKFLKIYLMLINDIIIIFISLYLALSVRLGLFYIPMYKEAYIIFLLAPLIAIPLFFRFKLYSNIIRFIKLSFIFQIFIGVLVYSIVWGFVVLFINIPEFPRSVIIINFFFTFALITNSRVFVKSLIDFLEINKNNNQSPETFKNIIIYGAGRNGTLLLESTKYSKNTKVVAFIDDSINLQKRYIDTVKVFPLNNILELTEKFKVEQIFITIPNLNITKKNHLLKLIDNYNISLFTLPSLADLPKEKLNLDSFRKINISDILGREIVGSNVSLLEKYIKNKCIFISGAGGSIGSEIALQSLNAQPSMIILYDNNEYSLFKIIEKIKKINFSDKIIIKSFLGTVLDEANLGLIFDKYRVNTIFHSAAYKHVSFVEDNIVESFINNVIGTYKIAFTAMNKNIGNFVHISSDKAVNPTNFMGATKRISELLVQNLNVSHKNIDNKNKHTKFGIVRFGNVIGSSGSVVPIFQKQINEGGPVRVTHKEATRYFMSISEAAQLVIQSSALGTSGDIFLLEMGTPVKIIDLAKKMIKLSGYNYGPAELSSNNIDINFIGLQKGEKLQEELYYGNAVNKTDHPKIFVAQDNFIYNKEFENDFKALINFINDRDVLKTILFLKKYVEGFNPDVSSYNEEK